MPGLAWLAAAPGARVTRPAWGNPFQSFWMGGFEGADHVNGHRLPLDLVAASGHLQRLDEDHRRAAQAGIGCVRESIGWRLCEGADGRIDLRRALQVQASAHRHGLQVLWTLMHYGVPDDLSLHDDALIPRLARFAAEVARQLGPGERAAGHVPVFTPVNEIGFLAWASAQHGMLAAPNDLPSALARLDANGPGAVGGDVGYAVKRRLAAAAIQAVKALRRVLPEARFLHVEPLVHVAPPPGRDDLSAHAARVRSWQWQACDMLAGRLEPALGGGPACLDIVGVNHYHNSQWEAGTEHWLDWATRDPRRLRFSQLLSEAAERYERPLVVAETSHVGVGRAAWLHEIADEVRAARRAQVPVLGLCVYPLVDRPDWQDPHHWHRSGLWHVDHRAGAGAKPLPRVPEPESLAALRAWQQLEGQASPAARPRPVLLAFSHLRWDFVRHRTRQLLQRLGGLHGGWQVVLVEEPLATAGTPRVDVFAAGPHLHVAVPHTRAAAFPPHPGTPDCTVLQNLLAGALGDLGVQPSAFWLSTPMAWPLVQGLARTLPTTVRRRAVVYDCADELSAFLGAPSGLPALEQGLLRAADGVLCATEALAAPRRAAAGRRLSVLANGVDARAFKWPPASHPGWDAMEAAALAGHIGGPQLGYAGAIDERLDLGLVAALAQARPQWQFVFMGPVVKIDPHTLPRGPNLHWLGEQPYRLLPAFMARWQVALVPFHDSAATRPSGPLKVLEALAAGLAVVATGVPAAPGWRAAGLCCEAGLPAVLAAAEACLAEPATQAAARRRRAQKRLRGRDWDTAAAWLDPWLHGAVAHENPARMQEPLTPRTTAM